ncbi:glycosyltransferase [Streptomyces chattanoogensis]|uniref:D-inositol 3-phosphate glycosyltransferase n=1 Tax=Streptomyces chattanoogensis TaxID=66876 RepID=A0A0N0H203_9ACTN|nr:glycosyltransferase [Streptomyces chattanoogensis]KPC64929.1 glycosyl transferase [Streptomyces chattanoogensis]
MKVLHVITGLEVGGAEQQLRLMLRRLPARCEVVTLTGPGPVADGIRADGIPVTHLGMTGNRDLRALPRLTRLIRDGGYDLVHTHLYRACVYGRIAARLAGVRAVVATEHSLGDAVIEGRRLTRGVRLLYRATERLGSATVAVSDTVAARLRRWGVPEQRIHVVPNGIEAHRFRHDPLVRSGVRSRLGIPVDAFVVGGVGRLVPAKRFDVLVRAVTRLSGVHLLLAGEGPELETLRRTAEQFGSANRIHLLGALGPDKLLDVPGLLAALDVFVAPSQDEAFGLAVLEALAAGLHVLYGSCPAIDELPADQTPGARRISPVVHEVTTALREVRRGGAERLPVPPVVRRYDIARSAESLMSVYEAAVAAAPDRRAARPQAARAAAPASESPAAHTPGPEPAPPQVSLPEPARSPAPSQGGHSLSKR